MKVFNNTDIVAKTANIVVIAGWILVILGGLLVFTGLFDINLVIWRVYTGAVCIASGAFSLVLYAILKGVESITRASEVYLNTALEENDE